LVLFLFHKNQELSLLLASGDVSSALQKIRDNHSQEKIPENVSAINYILKHARAQNHEIEISAVAGYAVLWKDVDIWKHAIQKLNHGKKDSYAIGAFDPVGKENVFKACSTFHFDDIETTYVLPPHQCSTLTWSHSIRLTAILDSDVTFRYQVDVIKLLRTGCSEKNVIKWCNQRMSLILSSLHKLNLSADDVPALLSVIADRGLAVLTDVSVHLFASSFVALPLSLAFYHNLDRNPAGILPSIFG
jgi:hypothetical protein